MAGYGFARFNFRGRTALFLFVMSALLIPIAAFAVPLYLVYAKVHLDSTMPGHSHPLHDQPRKRVPHEGLCRWVGPRRN